MCNMYTFIHSKKENKKGEKREKEKRKKGGQSWTSSQLRVFCKLFLQRNIAQSISELFGNNVLEIQCT